MPGVDGGDQLVLGDLRDRLLRLVTADDGPGGLVPGERGHQRGGRPVAAIRLQVLGDGAGGVHQVADHQGVEHAEAGQRLAEGAEGVEHRVGVEAVGAVGGGQQCAGVDRHPGLAQGAQQHRVQIGGGVDLEVDVLAGVPAQAQGDRPHQDRSVDRRRSRPRGTRSPRRCRGGRWSGPPPPRGARRSPGSSGRGRGHRPARRPRAPARRGGWGRGRRAAGPGPRGGSG